MSAPSSRKKKAGKARNAALLTVLFVNLIAPIVLLVVDKALPDGLFGRKKEKTEAPVSPRHVCRAVFAEQKALLGNAETLPTLSTADTAKGTVFVNKGSGNKIDNSQTGTRAAFRNEGNHNQIKNAQGER